MKLNFVVGNRLETLAGRLADDLKTRPVGSSPFAREVVAVMNPGNATWLTHELARQMGVCANIEFATRGGFWNRVIPGLEESATRFDPQVMSWRLLKMLADPTLEDEALKTYLRGEAGVSRPHFELANEIATVFDVYQVYRADVLRDWVSKGSSRSEIEAAPHAQWQKKLWQRLHAATGIKSPAELFGEFLEGRLDAQTHELVKTAFPLGRVFVFGIGTMPPLQVDLYRKLATFVDVRFFYLNPCRAFWGDNTTERQAIWRRRHGEDSATKTGNQFLSSLAESGKALFNKLLDLEEYGAAEELWDEADSHTILDEVQASVLDNTDVKFAERAVDDSLVVHICHSEMREMEVLRDDILRHLDETLAPGERLDPHDIVVMAPDISRYAPAIDAVFGLWNENHLGRGFLQYSVTDRTHAEESQLANAYKMLLSQWRGRMKFNEFRELLSFRAIWDKLGVENEAHRDIVMDHLYESGIRWGWDAEHRQKFCGVGFEENSWVQGLHALAQAYVRGTDLAGGHDGTELNDGIGRAMGAVADLATRVQALGVDLASPQPPQTWRIRLLNIVDTFLATEGEGIRDAETIKKAVDQFSETCTEAGADDLLLPCEVIEAYLNNALWSVANADRFLSGGITFCRLQPLRNIPAKYVWIAGMNDNEYPRRDKRRSFDLLKSEKRPGDRSDRDDDCQLLLEAILSARRYLRFSYVGSNAHDNKPIPPGVLLNEIRSELVESFGIADEAIVGGKHVAGFELRHHLHHFSPEYFDANGFWCNEQTRQLWMNLSQDDFGSAGTLDHYKEKLGARVALDEFKDADDKGIFRKLKPGCTQDCETLATDEVSLDDLLRFWGAPADVWLRKVLKIFKSSQDEGYRDDEPVMLNGLDDFLLKDQIVGKFIEAGCPDDDWFAKPELVSECVSRFRQKGQLPVGVRGEQFVINILQGVGEMAERIRTTFSGWRRLEEAASVRVLFGDKTLVGKIGNLYTNGKEVRMMSVRPSSLKLKDWMRLSIQTALLPLAELNEKKLAFLPSLYLHTDGLLLSNLPENRDLAHERVRLYFEGMMAALAGDPEPLMLIADKTSLAGYREKGKTGDSPEDLLQKRMKAARGAWRRSSKDYPGDSAEEPNKTLYGENLSDEFLATMLTVCDKYLCYAEEEKA